MSDTLTIAAAQPRAAPGDVEANVTEAVALIAQAREQGCDLLVFPELSLTGYDVAHIAAQPSLAFAADDPRLEPLVTACGDDITAIVGLPLREDGRLFIGSAAIQGGDVAALYRKQHLHGDEASVFAAGDGPVVVEAGGWKVGLAVCFDIAEPQHCAATAAAGAQVYAASVFLAAGADLVRNTLRLHERAVAGDVHVVAANYAGQVGPVTAAGHSSIWAPGGAPLAVADAARGLVTATITGGGHQSSPKSLTTPGATSSSGGPATTSSAAPGARLSAYTRRR